MQFSFTVILQIGGEVLCGFLLTLRLLCLRLLSNLKRWVSVFVSAWPWLRSIQMKQMQVCLQFCFCLLTFSLLFGINNVYAQTDTPTATTPPVTPTTTFRPLFPPNSTPTPRDYTCPGNQPIGYGTVTPNPLWSMYCSQCITPTYSFWDPLPTSTPDPNVPTPTATPPNETQVLQTDRTGYENLANIPNGYPVLVGYTDKWRNYVPDIYYKTFAPNPPKTVTEIYYVQADFTVAMMEPNTSFSGKQGGFQYFGYCNAQGGCKLELEDGTVINQTRGQLYIIYEQLFDNSNSGLIQSGVLNFKVEFTHGVDYYKNYEITLKKIGDYYWEKTSLSYSFTWDYEPIDLTPDPTPISSYCSEIDGTVTGSDPLEGDDNFSLPVIRYGEASCVSLGGFTIPMGWLTAVFPNATDVTIPGLQVCFTPLEFGKLNIFGLSVNLDTMAMIMAAVVLVRLLTRS